MDNEPFEPFVFYNEGDEMEVFLKPAKFYGKWINHNLTIYYSDETENEVVGVCIHNVSGIIKKAIEDE